MMRRLLHVDDESDIREVVQIALGLDPNFVTASCATGEQALAAAAAWSPDIILLDVMMPAMDGPTTLRLLRKDSKTAMIPVIFMTARAQSRELDEFRSLGVVGIISKPFDPMTLAASVNAHLRPQDARFDAMSKEFMLKANRELALLLEHEGALAAGTNRSSSLAGIQTVSHSLAGAGGIFGFAAISDAAASLETAVLCERNGTGTVAEIQSVLRRLQDCILASPTNVWPIESNE